MAQKFKEYGFSILVVALSTGISFLLFPYVALTNLAMIYILGTVLVASRGHRGPAAASSILNVLCFDFFFVPPRFTFQVSDGQYFMTFIVMFIVAMMISHLTIRLRHEAKQARLEEARTQIMHAFTQELASARGIEEVGNVVLKKLSQTFESDVVLFIQRNKNTMDLMSINSTLTVGEKEKGIAQWVLDRQQPAGRGTTTLIDEPFTYIPLIGSQEPIGALALLPNDRSLSLSPDQKLLLNSFSSQVALALEVLRFQDDAKKTELEIETERLRSSLLSSVSHDLKTPITAIIGSASTLLSKEEIRNAPKVFELVESIQNEGERLSRHVQNLLEITRLELSSVQLKKELFPLEEIIGSALSRTEKSVSKRSLNVKIPEDISPVPIDPLLIEQVFINLIENAVRHAPGDSPIDISVSQMNGEILVLVEDQGPGLKKENLEKIFEKFFHDKTSGGTGLGLAICRAIINAHRGRIWAENRVGGGSVFKFTLPLDKK